MHKIISISVFFIIFFVSLNAEDKKKYGKEITLTEKTSISNILDNPESFVGQKVLVEGTIVNVCKERGYWIELVSDEEFETIRVKVEDGDIVFPLEAKGKKALVEGEVYSFEYEAEVECGGAGKKDEESCNLKKKRFRTIYQIKVIGAEI